MRALAIIANRNYISCVHREGNHPDDSSRITYKKLLQEVCRFANVLRAHGVKKGDRVSIYMPMIMELPIAMLACNRIGAVHSIVVSAVLRRSVGRANNNMRLSPTSLPASRPTRWPSACTTARPRC